MGIENVYDKWSATGLETIKVCVEDKIADYCELNKKQCQEILNLVEKQQKEIEELKKPKYIINFETNEITTLTNDFVNKDKIKAKIEELEKMDIYEFETINVIDVLKSLLRKELLTTITKEELEKRWKE